MDTSLFAREIKKQFAFNPKEFLEFVSHMEVVYLKKHENWEGMETVPTFVGFVNKGLLRSYQLKDGNEFIHQFYQEGEFFGDYIAYQNQIGSGSIISAVEDCEILRIPFHTLEQLSERIPDVKRFSVYIGKLKEKQLYVRSTSLLMNSPEERYKELLLDRPDLIQRIPQYYLAQYIGVTPISLSRIRKRIFINKR